MAEPAYVRHAFSTIGVDFTRYPSAQIDHGTGAGRVLIAYVRTDQSDASMNFTTCFAGCTSSGSQAGGTAMTAGGMVLDSLGRNWARLFYLHTSLPTGTSWVVADATFTDRKPGIIAVLYSDSGGGTISFSAVQLVSTTTAAAQWTFGSTTGNNERVVVFAGAGNTLTPTSPAVASSADGTGISKVLERSGAATSTTLEATLTSDYVTGAGILMTAAISSVSVRSRLTTLGVG